MLKFTQQQQQQQVNISLQQLRTGSARGRRSTSVTIKAEGLSNKPIQYKYITVYTHLHTNGDIFEGIQKRLYTQIGSINILNLLNNSRVKSLTVSVCACACVCVSVCVVRVHASVCVCVNRATAATTTTSTATIRQRQQHAIAVSKTETATV